MNNTDSLVQTVLTNDNGTVPIDERKKIERKAQPIRDGLVKWLQKYNGQIKRKDHSGYQQRWRRWLVNYLFYEGRQYGSWDKLDGSWIDAIPTQKNKFYINNFFSWLVDSSLKEWARAKTKLIARPFHESVEATGAARVASWVLAHEQQRLRTPLEHQGEGLTGAMCGIYARYTAYSSKSGKLKGKMPRFEKKPLELASETQQCLECGMVNDEAIEGMQDPDAAMMTGSFAAKVQSPSQLPPQLPSQPSQLSMDNPVMRPTLSTTANTPMVEPSMPLGEMATCPQCGSPNLETMPAVNMEVDNVNGYDEVDAGEIITFNVDPFELRIHPHARMGRVKSTPYIYWEHPVLICDLEAAFEWADIEKMRGGETKENNHRYKSHLERSGGALNEGHWESNHQGDEPDHDTIIVTECWLDYRVYANKMLEKPVEMDNGDVIPANIKLGEVFPDGLYYCMAGQQLLQVRNENKNKHWTMGVYAPLPTSFWGRGVEDAVQDQKLLNDTYNLFIEYLRRCSSPTQMVNSQLGLDVNDFSGYPGEIIVCDGVGLNEPMSNGYLQVSPPAMPGHIPAFIQERKQDMQAKIGAFSTSSGAPDIDITTATGIKLLREASIALIAKALAIKAQVDTEWGEQVLELAQENWIFPHPVEVQDEYGAIETKWFTQIDLQGQIQVTYAEGSITPRSEIEKRNDLIEAATAFGVPLGIWNPSLPNELRRAGAEVFSVPFNADLFRQSERLAKIRCDELLELAEMAMNAGQEAGIVTQSPMQSQPAETEMAEESPAIDPFLATQIPQILAMVPIDALMEDHQVHMQYIKNWFHKDEGIYAPDFVKEVMRARYQEHMNASVQQAQMQSMAAMAAQAPQMMAAVADSQGNPASNGQTPNPPKNLDRQRSTNPDDLLR